MSVALRAAGAIGLATLALLVSTSRAHAADPVIAAAGDIACDPADAAFNAGLGKPKACQQLATDRLFHGRVRAVLALGDVQYECAGLAAFERSYDLSWGRDLAITHPVLGNHEYFRSGGTGCAPGAAGYFRYFGARAGNARGNYAFDIGAWHLIALNANCAVVGGCNAGSPQGRWLADHLGGARCTLAFWHEPRYTGRATPDPATKPFWEALYGAGADVVLNGHVHSYARFDPLDQGNHLDVMRGIRQFIVGTGGKSFALPPGRTHVAASAASFGVLELTLHPTSYAWRFLAVGGKVLDSGSAACH